MAVILMGVAGSGKTTVGLALSEVLRWPFFDGDHFHPPGNIAKMSHGIPLEDQDRLPWLAVLNQIIHDHLKRSRPVLLACSALKRRYREQLAENNPGAVFIYLKGDFELIFARLQNRPGHFMSANLLRSQLADLDEPEEAIIVDVDKEVDAIVQEILQKLELVSPES